MFKQRGEEWLWSKWPGNGPAHEDKEVDLVVSLLIGVRSQGILT
jgi:hypothetical protein